MNDVSGNWVPPEEDGIETTFETFRRNIAQRLRERRTRKEDEQHPFGEIPFVEALRLTITRREGR